MHYIDMKKNYKYNLSIQSIKTKVYINFFKNYLNILLANNYIEIIKGGKYGKRECIKQNNV